jgi:uncharacterized protein YceK
MTLIITKSSIWILLAGLCSGCGTMVNQDYDRKPYGGVVWDFRSVTGKQGGCVGFPPACMVFDLPFSFVGDTLFLPFDAYYTHQVNAFQEEQERNPPDPNPLIGWQANPSIKTNSAVEQDYLSYINQLPKDQKKSLILSDSLVQSFMNESGSQAVQIEIFVNPILFWKHVLFYDQAQTRTKIMKYRNGRLVQ